MNKAIFLDRDGVLVFDKHYLKDPDQVELVPGAQEALLAMLQRGYLLFLFTNQSGVGRGYYTMADVNACNASMLRLLDLPQPGFTEICVAPEAPSDPQVYRKPSPRFILEMVEKYQLDPFNSWMVGDKLSDLQAGLSGNINAVWVATGNPIDHELEQFISNNLIPQYQNLQDFAKASLSY